VAVDGTDSPQVKRVALDLQETLGERGMRVLISRWDASALFTDFAAAPVQHRDVSPRTLMLLYAADLAFRIRWEIGPTVEAGHVVIAAPYVATAVAFGVANGLSHEWLTTVFRFAPQPARTVILREPKGDRVWKRRPERGFGDCCTALLEATPEGFQRRKTRSAMAGALATAAEQHGGLYRKKERRELVEQLVTLQHPRAAASTSRRRARSA
jgi:thymidylate kinase